MSLTLDVPEAERIIVDADDRATRYVTADEFEAMRDTSGLELVDGRIVGSGVGNERREMGNEAQWMSGEIYGLLRDHVKPLGLGWVYPAETSFRCFGPDRDLIRKADAAFVRRGRLPDETPPLGVLRLVPDLVVEVVSPSDLSHDVDVKVQEYLDAGVPLVWVVFPFPRTVRVHPGRDGRPVLLTDADDLDGGDVLPGFRCKVADFFPPRPAA